MLNFRALSVNPFYQTRVLKVNLSKFKTIKRVRELIQRKLQRVSATQVN